MSHNNNNKNIQIQALISFLTFITNAYCAQPTPTAPTYLLHSAVQSGVLQNIAQALQTNSADINALDQEKRTPLHLAVTNYKLLNVQKYAEIVDLLMQHNADVNQYCGEHDEPPLFSAIRHKYGAPYLALLKHGADVNARTRPYFYNPLLLAAHYCTYDAIEPLLQHKADINATDLAGNTPLILAAYFPTAGNFKTVQKLIGAGADLDQKNNDKVTALHIARDDAIRSILLQAQIKQRKIYIPSRDWYPPVQPQQDLR